MFKPLEPKPDFPELEKEILKFWEKNQVLKKYLKKNEKSQKRFSFLDGPITANNPMGVHHAWGRTYKDLWQRYFTMRGFRQRYQNSFDCQGLWVEVEVEKELGFKSKKDIEKYGIAQFVEKCKERVKKYSQIQTEQSERLGYFMDWDNSYYTMSDENNYGIWGFLKKCWEDGNLYKGRDSVPWCPRCETAISQHEILQEEYRLLTHKSVIVKFPTQDPNIYLLAWTTTPWSIPGTIALMVNPNFIYVKVKQGKDKYILAKERLSVLKGEYEIIEEFKGEKMVGTTFTHPYQDFPTLKGQKFPVISSEEFVTLEIGTGIVTNNPGVGHEDYLSAKEVNLEPVSSIDGSANFLDGYQWLSGKYAKDDKVVNEILQDLETRGFVYDISDFTHRYPICWRCKTELVFRLVDEWYIAMDKPSKSKIKNQKSKLDGESLRKRLIKVAKKINWLPKWGLDRELDWLKNMSDWLISKKRYWGLALPIWECECGHFEVIGSKEELKKKAIEGWQEFEGNSPHRPWVDVVKIKCSKCGRKASRIPDVGNPWLDAGIVPFSTMGYFQDKNHWQNWFPADFITESFPGQFKNWFYSLLVMSTVLENTKPFETVLGYASVRDEKGEEMHKSKGNAIWFDEAAEKTGVDGMRWIYVTANPELNLGFGYNPIQLAQRRFLLILWNVVNFFITYVKADGWKVSRNSKFEIRNSKLLDRWILARSNELTKLVTDKLEQYDARTASVAIEKFVIEDLSTWYLRRSRQRRDDGFYSTLYQVLLTTVKLVAPFIPFISEKIYQHIGSDNKRSIHLEDWPTANEGLIDHKMVLLMEKLRKATELGHAIRSTRQIKVRQPLAKAWIYLGDKEWNDEIKKLLEEELNVEEVELTTMADLKKKQREKKIVISCEKEIGIAIDIKITQGLKDKGNVREITRFVQDQRKKEGLTPGEKVNLFICAPTADISLIKKHKNTIEKMTNTKILEFGKGNEISVSIKK